MAGVSNARAASSSTDLTSNSSLKARHSVLILKDRPLAPAPEASSCVMRQLLMRMRGNEPGSGYRKSECLNSDIPLEPAGREASS